MLNDKNSSTSIASDRRPLDDALQLGPRKRPCLSDPLVHYGRHFGCTIHALCSVKAVMTNGMLRMAELQDQPDDSFTPQERCEHRVFIQLLQMVPGLEERLFSGEEGEVLQAAELIQRGVASTRSDDTKGLKGPILDWISPEGSSLTLPLSHSMKMDRGFQHEATGRLLCPVGLDWSDAVTKEKLRSGALAVPGDQWPIFIYANNKFNEDDPWKGLLRGRLLVMAYKHVFTSPSSVEKEPKATRSGNARIHGMTSVLSASIAYIAMQTRFSLSSSAVFLRSDLSTDLERFYNSIIEFLDDPEEAHEVRDLLTWWNRQVFPRYIPVSTSLLKHSALGCLKARHALMRSSITTPL
ncbi:hypothetical protein BDQ12DRAFT_614041 [Crucibulum laeve]|uniref:Uncharacterized protein n=1 Tax=Crucibulum laeve TaxID=68775 RepID=A0A5C3LZ81_9AGAR|nr:hypothetical protein BDQ12DRAFT_614041 [Crucibulum laeve]